MLVSELLLKKAYLEDKVKELKSSIANLARLEAYKGKAEQYKALLEELFVCIDTLNTYKIILDRHNSSTKIKSEPKDIELATAIRLMKALENKLDTLTDVINSGDPNINTLVFMGQRENLLDEYLALVKLVKQSDWNSNID